MNTVYKNTLVETQEETPKHYSYFYYYNSKKDTNCLINLLQQLKTMNQLEYITTITQFIDLNNSVAPKSVIEKIKANGLPCLLMPGGYILFKDDVLKTMIGMAEEHKLSATNYNGYYSGFNAGSHDYNNFSKPYQDDSVYTKALPAAGFYSNKENYCLKSKINYDDTYLSTHFGDSINGISDTKFLNSLVDKYSTVYAKNKKASNSIAYNPDKI